MNLYNLKNKNIRCIAFDLDRTLLRPDGSLSPRTRQALCDAAGRGIALAAVSGRPFCALPKEVLSLPGLSYAAVSNGAAVYEKGNRIYSRVLDAADVDVILQMTRDLYVSGKLAYEVFADGSAFAEEEFLNRLEEFGFSESGIAYTRATRRAAADIFVFTEKNKTRIDSLDLIIKPEIHPAGQNPDPGDSWRKVFENLQERLPGVYVTSFMAGRIELSHRSANKADALKFILDRLHLSAENCIAFGDGENDAGLLCFAGIGVAVANAAPACREAADYICPSCGEDGAAQVIEELLKQMK